MRLAPVGVVLALIVGIVMISERETTTHGGPTQGQFNALFDDHNVTKTRVTTLEQQVASLLPLLPWRTNTVDPTLADHETRLGVCESGGCGGGQPAPACSNTLDDDGDQLVDFPADPGCTSASDGDEFNAPPAGPTYYVRLDGNNANNGLTNNAAGAWRTIDWAMDHVVAGDTIRVQAGVYSERVSPAVSGAAGNLITLVADGAVTFCGAGVSSKNYIRVVGFTIDTDAGCTKENRAFDFSGTSTGWEFWNNTFRDANYNGIAGGDYPYRHHNFIVIGNRFAAMGGVVGNGTAISLRGNDSVFAYNDIDGVDPDAFGIDGQRNRWLNNYIHNVTDALDGHSDVFQGFSSSLGLIDNLFEGNFAVGNGALANEHGVLLQNSSTSSCSTGTCGPMTENLFRRNVWHNISGGVIGVDEVQIGPITNTRQVHDTLVDPMRTAPTQGYGTVFNGAGITARLHNNINYRAWGQSVVSGLQVFLTQGGASILSADYNLAYTPDNVPTYAAPWTSQANPRTNVNPVFVNHGTDDFTLQATSGARGTAGPLTTTAGSGSGTTFNVATGGGGYFRGPNSAVSQYAGGLTAGDVLFVGLSTVTVASVSGDAITVTAPFTWNSGEAVYLAASGGDIGAYPYLAGGFALTATQSIASGTATITPSNSALVRFVVCYQDGVPTTVDKVAPYTCPVGSGAFEARVYPLYASKTLHVVAQ